ncbi:MAG: hypothetical protein ACI9XO_004396 [Paraglaciecola sp.]|jgi:hypothetical protein
MRILFRLKNSKNRCIAGLRNYFFVFFRRQKNAHYGLNYLIYFTNSFFFKNLKKGSNNQLCSLFLDFLNEKRTSSRSDRLSISGSLVFWKL